MVWGLTNQIDALYDVSGSRPIRSLDMLICIFNMAHLETCDVTCYHGNEFAYAQKRKKTGSHINNVDLFKYIVLETILTFLFVSGVSVRK